MTDYSIPITTKITRIGNSKGIVVPKTVVKALALTEGDTVELIYNESSQEIIIKFPDTKQLKLTIN